MKAVFRVVLAISLLFTMLCLSACKDNGKLDSPSNISDSKIQTGQDVVVDLGVEE